MLRHRKQLPMTSFLCLLAMLFFLTGSVTSAQMTQVDRQPATTFVKKPDLVVESVNLILSSAGTGISVTVEYVYANTATVDSWCCPTEAGRTAWAQNGADNTLFQVKVYKRDYPSGVWSQLGGTLSTHLKAGEKATARATTTDTIARDSSREYKVVVDYGNWIMESKEDNNEKTARRIARTR